MRISFPHLDYSGSLFIAEAGALEERRERLAQSFSGMTYLMKHLIYTFCQVTRTITGHRQSTAIFTNL